MSPTGSPEPIPRGSLSRCESANIQNQMDSSESAKPTAATDRNPFAPSEDVSAMTDSLRESTQLAAPAVAKLTVAQMEAKLEARLEAIRVRAAADAATIAQLAASGEQAAVVSTPKRARSPSLEASSKRRGDTNDLDQSATEEGEIVELTPIQEVRRLNLRDLGFPANKAFKCMMSVNGEPLVGGPNTKGYSINLLVDEGQYGLPHIRLLFKSNKPGLLHEDLTSKATDQEHFSICYRPGKQSVHSDDGMIDDLEYLFLSDPATELSEFDREALSRVKSAADRQKMFKMMLKINDHEVLDVANADTWMKGLGESVAANMVKLSAGPYVIALWILQSPGLLRALNSFRLAFQARLPLLHQYYNDDLSAPVLDLQGTPYIGEVGNGMYVIHPKKLDERGREVLDAFNRPIYDTNEPVVGYRSLPFLTDWNNTEHFMIYNGLNVIREYQFQYTEVVNMTYVPFNIFIKKMPGFKIGTEVLRVDRNQYSPKHREITSSFLVYFRTPSKDGVKETPPQEGTRVRIMFPANTKQEKSEDNKRIWNGIVIRRDLDELKSTGCDFCVLASKPSNTFFQQAHDELMYLPDSELQSVTLKITLSDKPALRELKAVKEFCTSNNPQIQDLRDLLINKADPNQKYHTIDITGGPNNDKKLKKLFNDRINAIEGLNDRQKQALGGLQKIPMGVHIVEGPPGTAKTSMIANTVWPCVEVGHRICCFTATNTAADHLCTRVIVTRPAHLKDEKVIRMGTASLEDLMIKRSSDFDNEMLNDEHLQQLPMDQQFNEPEDNDPLFVMGLEQITHAVMENDAMFSQMFDEFMEQNTARQEAFRLLQEKANQGGALNVPLATTLAYRIWELEMQDYIAATKEYDAEYQERIQGLNPMQIADMVSDMRSIDDRNPSGRFKKYREFYLNQDGRGFGATKRMFKKLTREMARRVMSEVSILIITANNAGSDVAELGFEPTLLICEEGGQANIANFCVPLTIFTGWQACLVSGDMKQLQPPVFGSGLNEVSQNGKLSILGLLDHKGFPSHKLEVQYRMDPDIALFPNQRFYEGKLKNGPNTLQPDQTKDILRRVSKNVLKIQASTFWMVDVQNGVSRHEAGGSSLQNYANANAIHEHVSMLLEQGIQASQITILVYYRAQSKIIAQRLKRVTANGTRERMYSNITTVDSFHGSESDIIILDLVAVGNTSWIGKSQVLEMDDVDEAGEEEANAEGLNLGESRVFAKYTEYAKNCHRLNVACTRAKMGLIVFCHTQSMLATSRVTKGRNGVHYEKSDLAALATNARDRRVVYKVQGFDSHPQDF